MENTDAPIEFQNENVRFTLHHKPHCFTEYDVEAFGSIVKEARKQAVKQVSKEISLPGFRKGRVPDELVIKNFPSDIDKQWQQQIATLTFQACQKLSPIQPLRSDTKITFNMKNHSENGALLTLKFETEPVIPLVDPKEFVVKSVARPLVNEDKINETIRQIQLFFAKWEHVDGRPVQEGDFVLLDVEVIEKNPATPLFSNTRFEVVEKSMSKWMFDLVLGKQVGESLEGISVPDETATKEEKEELKPKKVRVKINSIDVPTIPSLDDNLFNMLGVSSFEQLKERVTALLNKQADDHVRENMRSQVNTFLIEKYPFELPETLIKEETHFRFKQLSADPDFHPYWNQLNQEERTNLVTLIQSQAEKAVRLFYLCRKVIENANISVTAQDIPPAASDPLEFLLNPQKIHHHKHTPEIEHAEAYSRILLEKAEDYLIANAAAGL